MTSPRPVEPPARRLRLLANVAPAGAVVFGLLTVWLVVGTVAGFVQLVDGQGPQPALALGVRVLLLVVELAAALLAALVAYRLAVEVPRTVRRWDEALGERVRVLRGR